MNLSDTIRHSEINGVNVEVINGTVRHFSREPDAAEFVFRADNRWSHGSNNYTSVSGYFGCGREQSSGNRPFRIDADEPDLLDGRDSAPNPAEYVLHALLSCLTTTMIYHAAVRGITIRSCTSHAEGDIDLRGLLGIASNVRKGYHDIRVIMKVDSDNDVATLKELAMFSPVYDIVSRSLPVKLRIEKL